MWHYTLQTLQTTSSLQEIFLLQLFSMSVGPGGGGFFSSHILPVTNNIHYNRYVALSEGTEIGLKYILKLKSDMSFHFHLFVPP